MPFGSRDSLNAARSGIPHLKPRSLVTSECVHRWIAAWSTVIEAWGAEPGGKGSPSMFQPSVWPWAPGDQKNKIPDKKQTQLAPSVRRRGSASQMTSSEIKELSPSRAAASSSSCQNEPWASLGIWSGCFLGAWLWGFSGHVQLGGRPRQTQNTLEESHVSSGLGATWDLSVAAGKCCWLEESLDYPT